MDDKHFYFDEINNIFYINENGLSYKEIFDSLKPIKDDWTFYEKDDVFVTISKNSKIIKFIKGKDIKEIFITNAYQVLFLLNKFNFNHYKIDGKNKNEINIGDNLGFSEIEYLDNLLYQEDFAKVDENIKNNTTVFLNNLSLMYFNYQKIKEDSEFILTKERNAFITHLKSLFPKNKFIPICGPKSIGKTTTLLYYLKMNARRKYFYINLNYCKKLFSLNKKEELYLCICKELFNCMQFKDVQIFYNYLCQNKYSNIMELLDNILNYMELNFPYNQCYILIDQYKEKIDKNFEMIKKIETKTKISDKFYIIVCSSINEYDFRYSLNKKLEKSNEFFLDYLFINKLYSVDKEISKQKLNEKEMNLLDNCGNLFIYYYNIKTNKILEQKPLDKIKTEIKDHIINEINECLDIQDNHKKISVIRIMHDYIGKKVKFAELNQNLSLFPFKYFNLTIENNNMFSISDLKDDTELIIQPCYPIVIDCINTIFQDSKYQIKLNSENSITMNTIKNDESSELEKNFNDYLWIYRNSYFLDNCKIVDKIKVSSLLDANTNDLNIIKEASTKLVNISESILITQIAQNARHYDTAILKLCKIENGINYFELYLFQETLKKKADERLFNLILIEDKMLLKYLLFIDSEIKIKNVYFSYIFDKNNLDNATINYCKFRNINYKIYDDDSLNLIDSNINPLIRPKFEFPMMASNSNEYKKEYSLEVLDINYSRNMEQLIEEENKLKNFLNKKRELKKNQPKELSSNIKKVQKYVNNDFRNYEIEGQFIQEYSMLDINEKIVGISFLIDNETKKLKEKIQFSQTELRNLKDLMNKNYHSNIDILKIIKLEGIISLNIPDYDCCILQVNKNGDKFFVDLKEKISYSLKNKSKKYTNIDIDGDYYLIKFISTSMI